VNQLIIDVIIPVRNMAAELQACLATLMPQLGVTDRVVVVDDASTDDTVAVAQQAGAEVLTVVTSRGPYAARHLAASASVADVLLFIDARCRPQPGLVDQHRRLHGDTSVNLSCSPIRIVDNGTLLNKVVAAAGLYDLADKVNHHDGKDYFPTANLGVRRSAYEKVGGFSDVSSGGDVDLCWRIQAALGPSLRSEPDVCMLWNPRATWRETFAQWEKYGRSHARLIRLYPHHDPHPARLSFASRLWAFLRELSGQARQHRRDPRVPACLAALNLARYRAFSRAIKTVPSEPSSRPFGWSQQAS
jgi:glycosyltransferase involved in cell wall biosynthesis